MQPNEILFFYSSKRIIIALLRFILWGEITMACLGVLFAIDDNTVQCLENISRSALVDYLQGEIEELYFEKFQSQVAEIEKAWDAIQRAFSESECDLDHKNGTYPGNMVILGGKILYGDKIGEEDYIISLKTPHEVADIYEYLYKLEEFQFRDLYFKIDKEKYGFDLTEDDFEYTWAVLSETVKFWELATERKLSVIFTVDQ